MTLCDTSSTSPITARRSLVALFALLGFLTAPAVLAQGDPIVADSSFEAGTPSPAWTEFSTVGDTPICDAASCGGGNEAFDGDWWVWFGRTTGSEISTVSQELTIPTTVNTLSFYLQIPNAEKPGAVRVDIDGTRVFQANETNADTYSEYQQVLVEVDNFADGGTHTLAFSGIIGAGDGTQLASLFVDLVTFTAEPREPSFVVDPLTLSFGEVQQSETSDPQIVSISNGGNATGMYEIINIADGDVLIEPTLAGDADGTVERDSTEQISVSVRAIPTAEPGMYTTSFTLLTDDPENPEITISAEVTVTPFVSNEDGAEGAAFRFETYPNPFTAQATLRYTLPEATAVRVEVYDVTGRRVATLVDEPQAAGSHEVEWDAAGLPSGVYVYQVDAGRFSETQPITLVR